MNEEIRVLYVDDDHMSLRVRSERLEEYEQFEVVTATSVADGQRRLTDHRIDCVLSDLHMDTRTGLTFLKTVRRVHPDLPFILFSDDQSDDVIEEAFSAGVTDYIPKSICTISYRLLVKRIENAVEHYHSQHKSDRFPS